MAIGDEDIVGCIRGHLAFCFNTGHHEDDDDEDAEEAKINLK